jgi:hypothetical protein
MLGPGFVTQEDLLLSVPPAAGRAIVEEGGVATAPLMGARAFASFAAACDLAVDSARLLGLERLGLFKPVFRVVTPPDGYRHMSLPPDPDNNWFERGWAFDTTTEAYEVAQGAEAGEAYYSRFQIDHLGVVLGLMGLEVRLDEHLLAGSEPFSQNPGGWLDHARSRAETLRSSAFRPAVALLCQFVSDLYSDRTRTDLRNLVASQRFSSDPWIVVRSSERGGKASSATPERAAALFALTPQKLRHAVEALAVGQERCNPLAACYQLAQFVELEERDRLKGTALRAATLREAAGMLADLHRALYGEALPHPSGVTAQVTHMPDLEVRADVQRHLEFVADRYGVNPRPKLAVFLEGRTEELVAMAVFEKVFGLHPRVVGIEIVNLQGVDSATGSRRDDRFRAILRLVDYLHHHQTLTFLILDNENAALRLKQAAREFHSLVDPGRLATRLDHVHVWRRSFEFDNFSDSELAAVLRLVSADRHRFTRGEVRQCREARDPGAALAALYRGRCDSALPKLRLAQAVLDLMFSPDARSVETRPIVRVLSKVYRLAALNPLPTMKEIWERNQAAHYLGQRAGRERRPQRVGRAPRKDAPG